MAKALSYLPSTTRTRIKRIVINPDENPEDPFWRSRYDPDHISYMTAGDGGVIYIYPQRELSPDSFTPGALIHETGHIWSFQQWGTNTKIGKWVDWEKAKVKDQLYVSEYARNHIVEDIAETIRVYVSTKGTPRNEEYRQMFPNRFAMLDQEYT